jgi:chemotaxis signal transduction protein
MENGQRPGNSQVNAEALQQALRAFGAQGVSSASPAQAAELAVLAQRMGLPTPTPAVPQAPTAAAAGPQFVICALGGLEIALPAAHVSGVERVGDITPVPNTVAWVLGVANLRGAITSVVDLRQLWGLPREEITARARVVVATAKDMIIGFLVDGVAEFRALPSTAPNRDAARQQAPAWLAPYVMDAVVVAGRRIFALDVETLLFADMLHRYRADG